MKCGLKYHLLNSFNTFIQVQIHLLIFFMVQLMYLFPTVLFTSFTMFVTSSVTNAVCKEKEKIYVDI